MPRAQAVSTPHGTPRFDQASVLAGALRAYFESGATRAQSWRLSQLDALEHFLMEREKDIVRALRADLRKPETEAFVSEIGFTLAPT